MIHTQIIVITTTTYRVPVHQVLFWISIIIWKIKQMCVCVCIPHNHHIRLILFPHFPLWKLSHHWALSNLSKVIQSGNGRAKLQTRQHSFRVCALDPYPILHIILLLCKRKMRFREIKYIVQYHMGTKQ